MITTIATRFSFAALGVALAILAAGPAVSAVHPEKQFVVDNTRYFSGVPLASVAAFVLQTPIQPMDMN